MEKGREEERRPGGRKEQLHSGQASPRARSLLPPSPPSTSHAWTFVPPQRSKPQLPKPGAPRAAPPALSAGQVPWGTDTREGGRQDLERGLQVGPESAAAAPGVDPLAAPAEDHVDLDVNQQRDDEGHVEGDHGGVDHEGGVGNDALALLCGRDSPGRARERGPRPGTAGRGARLRGRAVSGRRAGSGANTVRRPSEH